MGEGAQSSAVVILAAKLPDAPVSLADNAAETTAYQIGLTWADGSYNGGTPIIDYEVSFKQQAAGSYTVFQTGVLTKSTTVTSLTPGVTYNFYVRSRNLVGYSPVSSVVTILAA